MVSSNTFSYKDGVLDKMRALVGRSVCWVVLRIAEGGDSECDMVDSGVTTGNDDQDFEAMAAVVPDDQPRWILIDFHYEKGGVNNNKVVFIAYTPDACTKVSDKFAYANNKEKVKSQVTV